jgi:UDP-N-acetylmuramoyl-L-alanyl-D-glutamate--2,6-diaminopimelate ligase
MLDFSTPSDAARWLQERVSGTLQSDSRKLRAGDGFIAWPGAASDARQHVAAALKQGASACLVEKSGVEAYGFSDPRVAVYGQLKSASGAIAADYFGQPSQQLKLLAVTGTNGKTSTVWWLAQALSQLKQVAPVPCAMVGTLGVGRPPVVQSTGLTTPDPVLLQRSLRDFVDSAVVACAIEASSIGLAEQRLQGCQIHSALFTNFTQDHLDYHGSMEDYWQAKMELFAWPGLRSAVVNIDDPKGLELLAALDANALDVWSVSCVGAARLQACDISHEPQGLRFTVLERGADEAAQRHLLQTNLIGLYNVSNLLGVLAMMRSIGVPLAAAVDACSALAPVPGRMEFAGQPGQTLVAVDYAHTPDALGQALLALRPISRQRGGQLWCVFGCGGDRDATKRPLMGAMAARYADKLTLTSDNPRSEKPEAIISQILLGLSGQRPLIVEPDRALAIAQTLAQAGPADVVLLAGKGHEDYQEVAGQRLPFSDLEHVRRLQNKSVVRLIEGEVVHG